MLRTSSPKLCCVVYIIMHCAAALRIPNSPYSPPYHTYTIPTIPTIPTSLQDVEPCYSLPLHPPPVPTPPSPALLNYSPSHCLFAFPRNHTSLHIRRLTDCVSTHWPWSSASALPSIADVLQPHCTTQEPSAHREPWAQRAVDLLVCILNVSRLLIARSHSCLATPTTHTSRLSLSLPFSLQYLAISRRLPVLQSPNTSDPTTCYLNTRFVNESDHFKVARACATWCSSTGVLAARGACFSNSLLD
jgi:hypothetical protein